MSDHLSDDSTSFRGTSSAIANSAKKLAEMAKAVEAIKDMMPKIDPAVANLLSNPVILQLAEQQAFYAQLPKLAPEFVESMRKIHEINRQLADRVDLRAFSTTIAVDKRLLDAAAEISLFTRTAGKLLREQLHPDHWPIMQSFKFEEQDVVLADIDLDSTVDTSEESPTSLILEEAGHVKRIITDIFEDDKTLLSLEPHIFEEVIAELLRSQGFTVELTKRTRDGGYDLIAIARHAGFPLKFLVECKRYTTEKIGIDIVRSLMYVVQEQQANKGIIATTSYFTKDVKQKQQSAHPYQLDLRDKNDILSWIQRYGEEHLLLRRPNA
jgi:HJR/Mrr/RecB family endonuclease